MQIEIIGKFFDNHSLAKVNRNIALSLAKKVDVKILPLDNISIDSKLSSEIIDKLLSLRIEEEQENTDIQIRHHYPMVIAWPKFSKTKIVYIQPWEFMAIPSEWQYKFDTFADAVITPSEWTRNVFLGSGVNPNKVFVVPNGYDPDIYYPKEKTDNIFTYVGCHQYRKGIDVLLESWAKYTKRNENVELIIKDTPQIYGSSDLQAHIIKLQYQTNCAKITYIDEQYSEKEMAELYQKTKFLVHPYRGEGFGMHILEAEQCGAIGITTSGGPTEEFSNGIFINSTKQVVNMQEIFAIKPGDSLSLMGQHKWVLAPDVNDLGTIIRECINKYPKIEKNKTQYTWDDVANKYLQIFEDSVLPKKLVRNDTI